MVRSFANFALSGRRLILAVLALLAVGVVAAGWAGAQPTTEERVWLPVQSIEAPVEQAEPTADPPSVPSPTQEQPTMPPTPQEPVVPVASGDELPRFQAGEYVLGIGDRLRVIVFGEEELSGEFVVDSTGIISFPLIGDVEAAGSSVREFQDRVEARLREGFLVNPRVSAEVLNFRPFYILGEVQEPGEYAFTNGLTVLNAVATAGGFTPLANQTRVFIKPAGTEAEREIDLTAATPVAPGDTIRIAKGAFYILGEVQRPGEYPFTEGMTVLNAVATAGGFTYRANQSRVFVLHEGAEEEESMRLAPNLQVQSGDTIRIGERFF